MRQNITTLFILLALILTGCRQPTSTIMTVAGPVDIRDMGITLPHEHVLVDFIGADSTGYHRWNRDTVVAKVLPYLLEARQNGISTMVECTPAYLGRDPLLLQELSSLSGINILTNTGYYGAINNKAIPAHAFDETVDQIAARWIAEFENGIEETGIKPGFIKIAVPGDSVLSPIHDKIVRAAARTHLKTGLVINAHTGPAAAALAELKVLQEEGVQPSAFIWTHAQGAGPDSHEMIARQGAWVSLDNVMPDNTDSYVSMLSTLKNKNLLNRVLISHDAGWYDVIDPESVQYRGYTAIFTLLKPALVNAGFTEDEWRMLVVENPAKAYAITLFK